MKKTKTFDCIKFKEEMQARLMREYKGLTDDEVRERMRHKLETSQSPIGKFWRKLQARNAEPAKPAQPRPSAKPSRRARRPA